MNGLLGVTSQDVVDSLFMWPEEQQAVLLVLQQACQYRPLARCGVICYAALQLSEHHALLESTTPEK